MLARTFGCARFVYNSMLHQRSEAWQERQEHMGYYQTSAALTLLKKTEEHAWLPNISEVSCVPLQQALRHLQTAFSNFFAKRAKFPNFKKKDGRQSAEYTASAFKWDGVCLKLAKMKLPLPIVWSRTIPKAAKVTTVTVSKDTCGRYHVSLLCDDALAAKSAASGELGIDLGLTHFATLCTGEKIEAPKLFRRNEIKLAKLQRQLSKKRKGSANRRKARCKVARMHAKTADSRKDFLHKLSTRLINRLVHDRQVIAIETLSVKNMLKNRCLAKSISDASWPEFTRQLKYKAQWYGRTVISVDKWFPSSKRCSDCGHTVAKMPLTVRSWTCPCCGSTHERDINAARNVLAAGLAVLAHGESVSPMS